MKKINLKKTLSPSNIIFIIVVALLLYPPSREWFMRKVAFSPSVNNVEESEKLASYNWDLKGINTEDVKLNDLNDKIIFVNFWATWCPPCRAEMPMIQKLYDDYKNDVAFLFVTNENWDVVKKYFDEKKYDLPVYNSINSPPSKLTETNSIPASYLIDKEGNILISKVGAANWDSDKVRNLLDELIKK